MFSASNLFTQQNILTPLVLDDEFKDKSFEVHLLAKRGVSENEILTVHDGSRRKKRIGWCIPVNALESNEHDFANNEHFLRYAYMAIAELFHYDLGSVYTRPLDSDSDLERFSDVMHPSTCLLVISKETLGETEFELDRFMPSLLAHGYSKLGERNPEEIVWSVDSEGARPSSITLHPISSDLGDAALIVTMLHHAVVYEHRPVFSFFYAYQVIELLMEHVFMAEQAAILEEYQDAAVDLAAAKEVIEKLQRVTSEKRRLELLIGEYTSCVGQLEDLRNSCGDFLRQVGRPVGLEFQAFFYGTRNFVFHQLRYVHTEKEDLLYPVVRDFVRFLPSLLTSYKARTFMRSSR